MTYKSEAILALKKTGVWQGLTEQERKKFEELGEEHCRKLLAHIDDWDTNAVIRLIACTEAGDDQKAKELTVNMLRQATKALYRAQMLKPNGSGGSELTNRGRKFAEFIDIVMSEGEKGALMLQMTLEELTVTSFVFLRSFLTHGHDGQLDSEE